MTLLRGHFAMTLICAGEADSAEVEAALQPLVNGSLDVTVREVPEEGDSTPLGSSYLVTVHGADRLGIVARLASVIADAGGNITDLTTRLSGRLYVLLAEVDVPQSADVGWATGATRGGISGAGCGYHHATAGERSAVNLTLPTLPEGRVLDVIRAPSQVLSAAASLVDPDTPIRRATLRRSGRDHAGLTWLRGSCRATGRGGRAGVLHRRVGPSEDPNQARSDRAAEC